MAESIRLIFVLYNGVRVPVTAKITSLIGGDGRIQQARATAASLSVDLSYGLDGVRSKFLTVAIVKTEGGWLSHQQAVSFIEALEGQELTEATGVTITNGWILEEIAKRVSDND